MAVLECRDPIEVALKHAAMRQARLDGIKHWWMWLREGPLTQDQAVLDRWWEEAVAWLSSSR